MIGECGILSECDAWSGHLRGMLDSLGIQRGIVVDNLVAGVAMCCRQYHSRGIGQTDLALLLARAFCSINDRASAEKVLDSVKPHARHVERWLEILSELHQFPALLPFFSNGTIRPADWAGARLDRMWTLDLDCLVLAESERNEMMLYRSLRFLVDRMAVFWDATEGEGILGLKGLGSFNVEPPGRRQFTMTTPGDLIDYVAGLLSIQRTERGWRTVPTVMNLDV